MSSSCPFTPFNSDYLADPFPSLAKARVEQPIFYDAEIGYWIVTRYADIKAIFRDHETFTAENTISPIVPFPDNILQMFVDGGYTPQPVLSNNVPPSHTRVRKQVNRLFTPRRMRHFAPEIRRLVNEQIDGFVEEGEVDIVERLTYDLPAFVLFRVLGVPDKDVPQVKAWSDNRIQLYYGRPTPEEQIEYTKDLVPFWHYTVDLVKKKVANLKHSDADDLTSDLIRMRNGDDAVLTLNEIASCMITLLVAGHETTTAQLTNSLRHLLENREHWQALCDNPALVANAVEEMMRIDPSVNGWRRLVRKATTIGGVDLPDGANLLLMLNSANRDDAVFPNADTIDLTRPNLKEHLAFGYGIHFCVGAPLARLELNIALEELVRRLPSLALIPNQTYDYLPNISFRGPQQLHVRWK